MAEGRTTLRRRLLGLLPRVGVRVTDLAPGISVLSRRKTVRSRPLFPGTYLVQAGPKRKAVEVTSIADETVLIRRPGHRPWPEVMLAERQLIQSVVPGVLMAHFERYDVNCVLDVGANKGQYAQRLRKAGFTGRIASFEPVPEEFARLSAAAADDPLWTVHQVALGAENGVLEMYVTPGTLSSPLPATEFGGQRFPSLRTTEVQEVPVRRLEDMLDELLAGVTEPRTFLKMDTQGYDVQVFRGLGKRTNEIVGLQSEVALMQLYEGMPRMGEALALYEGAGFEVSGLYPVNREENSHRVLEFDCLMVRAEALEGR